MVTRTKNSILKGNNLMFVVLVNRGEAEKDIVLFG